MAIAADATYLRVCDGYPGSLVRIGPRPRVGVTFFYSGQPLAECLGLLDVLIAASGNGRQQGALLDVMVVSRQARGTCLALSR